MDDFQRMTRDEIEHRYADQYVVVVEPEWDDPSSDEFTSARVVTAGQEWQETIHRARPLLTDHDHWVCGFTGDRQIVFQRVAALTFLCVSGHPLADECRELDRRTGSRIGQRKMADSARLTWEQIRERYPDRWVVMADHDLQEHDPTAYKIRAPGIVP